MKEKNPFGKFLLSFFDKTAIRRWTNISVENQIDQRVKVYPRFTQHPLPKPELPHKYSLAEALENRNSALTFSTDTFSLQDISTLLSVVGKREGPENRRVYPSAGAKYPIETYLIVLDCESLSPGLYHYNVPEHALTQLWLKDLRESLFEATNDLRVLRSSAAIVFSTVYGRTEEKYGRRGLRYGLMEVGHMAQNISLAAGILRKGCCEIGGFIDSGINKLLDVENDSETAALVMILGGLPD